MFEVEVKVKKQVRYVDCVCGVRYWEDAELNGVVEGDSNPKMPCYEKATNTWKPLIDLSNGQILNWNKGDTAKIHYKVADAGNYKLLDEDKNLVVEKDGYVPDMLCPKENGYGDYIIMEIDEKGFIKNFTADLTYFEEE